MVLYLFWKEEEYWGTVLLLLCFSKVRTWILSTAHMETEDRCFVFFFYASSNDRIMWRLHDKFYHFPWHWQSVFSCMIYEKFQHFSISFAVCSELFLGIPCEAWYVVFLVLLCLGLAIVIPSSLPLFLLPKNGSPSLNNGMATKDS